MITVNFFTSEKHTQPVIEALKKAENIKLLNIYKNLTFGQNLVSRFTRNKKLNTPEIAYVFLVADFGFIISDKILKTPKYGSLCIHPSLLPKYRGASPVQYAIMNGDKETGVTIFKMDEKVDHGPIIAQFKEKIRDNDTAETLYERLFKAGAEVLMTILPAWVEGRIKPRIQDHSKATYTPRLTRDDGRIDWQKSDEEIERFIRAMTPWPDAWTLLLRQPADSEGQAIIHPRGGVAPAAHLGDEKRLKILKAHLEKGKLVLDLVQLEGKKPITWQQFLAGHPNSKFL